MIDESSLTSDIDIEFSVKDFVRLKCQLNLKFDNIGHYNVIDIYR